MKNIINLIMLTLVCNASFAQNPCAEIDTDNNVIINVIGDPDPLLLQEADLDEDLEELGPIPCYNGPGSDDYEEMYDQGYRRDVFFVHGLGGNGGSWDNMVPYVEYGNGTTEEFLGWKVDAHTPSYDLNQTSLWSIGSEVEEEIMSFGLDELWCDNIAIGHSMGGLALRVMDQNFTITEQEKPYGAIITFATPHLGAVVAENLVAGEMDDFIVNACQALTAGPLQTFEEGNVFFDILGDVGLLTLQELKDKVCENVGHISFDQIKNRYTADVVADLVPNTNNINTLNNGPVDPFIRKALFYGVEKDNGTMAWRFFHSAIAGVNFPDEGVGLAGYNDDEPAKDQMHKVQNKYIGEAERWQEIFEEWSDIPSDFCLNPFKRPVHIDVNGDGTFDVLRCKNKGEVYLLWNSWANGETWTLELNDIWKNAIGMIESVETCNCIIDDVLDEDPDFETISWVLEEGEDCNHPGAISCWTTLESVEVHQSDAVVLTESQLAFPGLNYDPIRLYGSNHLQMRNDENTVHAMKMIFDGHIDEWFYTPKN